MTFVDNENRSLKFNEKEVAVIWFFMTGMRVKDIAEWTGMSDKSISYYKRRAMRKIGVKNNNEFIMWFLKNRNNHQISRLEFSILRRRVQTQEKK
ncbi:helix-turn-helix transcriptional regulator (plasmid) [Pantoea agglomerans]|uniref:helix-turn-helix transcriptional regulator n=1 Tax=Enterobacter agglomerans TaxID=549 RepID=UPI00083D0797|nr:LuxR C-terminal-related transcriptional regulator [Pantoea agglomerans]AOE42555.1 helix-turn-helix transcriptional regulator [Pantoea agglomerans]